MLRDEPDRLQFFLLISQLILFITNLVPPIPQSNTTAHHFSNFCVVTIWIMLDLIKISAISLTFFTFYTPRIVIVAMSFFITSTTIWIYIPSPDRNRSGTTQSSSRRDGPPGGGRDPDRNREEVRPAGVVPDRNRAGGSPCRHRACPPSRGGSGSESESLGRMSDHLGKLLWSSRGGSGTIFRTLSGSGTIFMALSGSGKWWSLQIADNCIACALLQSRVCWIWLKFLL